MLTFLEPSAPQNVAVAARSSSSSLDVHWDPPAHINGKLKEYVVIYTGPDGGSKTVTTSINNTTLKSLRACTEYTITVTATNGGGTSEPSLPVTGETEQEGKCQE